jgi:hypothetical protein
MKKIKVGKLNLNVCEHKGDCPYDRFVKFKQYVPQFWEKMDSPLFEVYWERFLDYHNKGEHAQGMMALRDYKFALDNSKNSYDAWGVCFALITESNKANFKDMPNDADLQEKIELYNKNGLLAETVKEHVLAFMQTSPETFEDHLRMYAIDSIASAISS